MRVAVEELAYSTYSAAERASPKPALTVIYGSTSTRRQRVMNSSVPTSLGCSAFQTGSKIGGRLSMSPIASRQSWAEMKLPPGQRYTPECKDFRTATTSGLQPWTLLAGMRETAPMQKVPGPTAVISSCALPLTGDLKPRGNLT